MSRRRRNRVFKGLDLCSIVIGWEDISDLRGKKLMGILDVLV
jgi:hypothetical protein